DGRGCRSQGVQTLGHGPFDASRPWRRAALAAAMLLAAFVGLATAPAAAQNGGASSTVIVNIRDFKYHDNPSTVPAGTITFRVVNAGPSTHEFNVDRTDVADGSLPLRADGLTVDEESPLLHRIGSLDTIGYQSTRSLTLRLRAGHYVLYCNLEGHYLGGMHVSLTVR
ncbi:MAG TPA: hypothetical protein VGU73_08940, partial [Acidimicrobiia bacterium]|nr:hypothetical protein [Acidimicrobiia bacterium]